MPARKSASDYMAESGHRWVIESNVPLQTAVGVCMDCSVTAVTNPAKIYPMMARKHREAARATE